MARSNRCSTCGAVLEGPSGGRCTTCGSSAAARFRPRAKPEGAGGRDAKAPPGAALTWMKRCPRCGHTGYGDHYFSKVQHIGLLVVLSLLTSGIGGVLYWLMRFQHRVCPGCGLNWRHASYRALPQADGAPAAPLGGEVPALRGGPSGPPVFASSGDRSINGWIRIGGGAVLGLTGSGWLSAAAMFIQTGLGFSLMPLAMLAGGAAAISGGAALIWSGIKRLRWRGRSAAELERGVLRLASQRDGRLTASEAAAYMDLSLDAAKKLLDGMELKDVQRVCSVVTDDGVIVYEFPELLPRPGRRWGGTESGESGRT